MTLSAAILLAVAILGLATLAIGVGEVFALVRAFRGYAAATEAARAAHEVGTDPALLERLEAAERRVAGIHEDVTRQLKKTAQERRRIEAAAGIDVDDADLDPAAVVRAAQTSLSLNGEQRHAAGPPPNPARPRLRPRHR